jgi:hypothetical protein
MTTDLPRELARLPRYSVHKLMTYAGVERSMGSVLDLDLNEARIVASVWVEDRRALKPTTTLRAVITTTQVLETFGPEVIDLGAEGLAVAKALASIDAEVPEGWERCGSHCPEAGKWGAGVDPSYLNSWTRRHAWRPTTHGGFTIHTIATIPPPYEPEGVPHA